MNTYISFCRIVVSFFMAVMVLGTAYDVIFIQWPKWQQIKLESKVRDNSVAEAKESESKMNGEIIDTNEKVPLLPQSKIQLINCTRSTNRLLFPFESRHFATLGI
jgi:hypothetical protein